MVSNKGKEVAGKDTGKRKHTDPDKTGGRKRRNRGVVQFFEDAAYEVDEDDDVSDFSDFGDWDFFEDELKTQTEEVTNEPGKAHNVPLYPKEEELSEEELEKMLQQRYRPGSGYVTYAEDNIYSSERSVAGNDVMPSYKEPTIWKVKCMVGREKQSAFCLMQKYVELNSLGNKLQIISAISVEHVKGFIYIEAERQSDINEACKGLTTIYTSRLAPVPKNEVSNMLSVRSKCNEVSVGSWARVKSGTYKGDLAQVIAVNDSRKKATIKLIPRIDVQRLAEKYGGGVAKRKTVVPAPRLITSSELEEFRPLIQYRRDRESGLAFEVLDGMMLKDGYLYKKVSIDSLSLWGVIPSEDELLKFESSKKEDPDCQEWLTELYGEKKKEPRVVKNDKGSEKGDKGESSSSSGIKTSFEVNDLVLFNRKDFGVVVGSEKDDYYKILKEGSEGPVVVIVDVRQLKKASFESKFTALDKRRKTISINDTVQVLEGPLEGRQGNVKHIYRGIIFLHDEIEQENNGYFCCKSQICEKIKLSDYASKGKDGDSSFSAFDDPPSSPKTPLSPEKPWENKERSNSFNRDDKEGMFTVGQSLRIRVGPLKGYLCRVLAIRRTDVTVKLDSQHKILTVKPEHLAEVRGRSSAIPISDDKDVKPFDLLENPDGSTDWMMGAGTSADGERSAWPAFQSGQTDSKKDEGGWGSKLTPKPTSTWGNAVPDEKPAVNNEQAGGWGSCGANWGKPKISTEDEAGTSSQDTGGWGSGGGNWGKPKTSEDQTGSSSQAAGGSWSSKPTGNSNDAATMWGKKDNASKESPSLNSWGVVNDGRSGGSNWGKAVSPVDKGGFGDGDGSGSSKGWGECIAKSTTQTAPAWAKTDNRKDDDSAPAWDKASDAEGGQGGSWGKSNMKKDDTAPAWGTTSKADGFKSGSWGQTNTKMDDTVPAWGKTAEITDGSLGSTSWGNKDDSSGKNAAAWNSSTPTQESQGGGWGSGGGSSWSIKQGAGGNSSWDKGSEDKGKPAEKWGSGDGGGSSWNDNQGGGSSWNKQDSGSSWQKQGEGSSWGKQNDGNTEGGFGGWNKAGAEQQDKFDGGRGFGGRGRRGGWRGGRGGRSFGEDGQESRGSERGGSFRGGRGSWSDRGRRGGRERSFGREDGQENQGGPFGGGQGGWSGRGGRGGGGRYEGGGFRGRGRSDRGVGFEGRGRGRRDENCDWGSNQYDGGGSSWKSGNDGADKGSSWGGSSWKSSAEAAAQSGASDNGWNKGSEGGGGGLSEGSWSKASPVDGNQSSGWGAAPMEKKEASPGLGWNSGSGLEGGGSAGTTNNPVSVDGGQPSILGTPNPGSGWGSGSGNRGSGGTWIRPGRGDGGQSSALSAQKGVTEDGGSSTGQWGKPPGSSSSWGKGNDNDGGRKGGW